LTIRIFLCAAFVAVSTTPVLAASQRDWSECANSSADATDRRIAACTRILNGKETRQDQVEAYAQRCHAWQTKGYPDRAIADCSQAIQLDPKYVYAHIGRGLAHRDKGDLELALADFDTAIRLKPTYANPYINRGLTWHDKGDLDRAIADYNTAIRLDPKSVEARYYRGRAWVDKRELDRAIADQNEAIRLNPKHADAYNARGNAWRAKGDFDRAIADLTEAISLDPGFAYAYFNRANAWHAKSNPDRAVADFTEALRLDPKHADSYANRGYTHFYRLDFSAAAADLLRATELAGGANAMLYLYIARARLGENAMAELEANAARLKTKNWPYPAIELFLGRRSPEATLSAAPFGTRCTAEFFIGQWHLLRGEPQAARPRFLTTIDACPRNFFEHHAAAAELRRMAP
jgi:tetratricopeptide (TPR) repeat protein